MLLQESTIDFSSSSWGHYKVKLLFLLDGSTFLFSNVFVTLYTVWFWSRLSFERSRVSLVAEKCFYLILVSQTERM